MGSCNVLRVEGRQYPIPTPSLRSTQRQCIYLLRFRKSSNTCERPVREPLHPCVMALHMGRQHDHTRELQLAVGTPSMSVRRTVRPSCWHASGVVHN